MHGLARRRHREDPQVLRFQTGVFGNPREHSRPDFFAVVESEHKIGPALTRESLVETGLGLDLPSDPLRRGERSSGLRSRPLAHTAATEMLISTGRASPCSRRSARTRRAGSCAFASASSAVLPEAKTPPSSGTSASQRPSSSRSDSMLYLVTPPTLEADALQPVVPADAERRSSGA